MKILCSTSSQADRDQLFELAATDTWIKVQVIGDGLEIPDEVQYIQVLDTMDAEHIIVREVFAGYIDDDYIEPNSEDMFTIEDVLQQTEVYELEYLRVIYPISLKETWEICSALEFAGFRKYDEGAY